MEPYYQDDACTIYHGDCREVLPTLEKVDLVLTDPPYGEKETHKKHLSSVTNRQKLGFGGLNEVQMVELANSWVEKSSRWVVFTCDWHFMEALHKAGLLVRFGIWRKPNGAPQFTGDRPGMGWEAVAICHRPGKKRWNRGGHHAFWEFNCNRETGHPTQKPIKLLSAFVQDFTDKTDVICDPMMGSGTTLRAAKDLGRKAIGIELEEKYCEIAAKRLAQEVLL